MSRTPVFVAVFLVVVSVGTGLVGADVNDGAAVPVLPAADGVLHDGTAGGVSDAPTVGSALLARLGSSSGDASGDPVTLDPAADGDAPVRVGVIGSAFGATEALDGRVAARYRTGGPRFGLVAGDHGAAVAGVVARRADESALYLASVGYEPTPASYARAVDWLIAQDVDVLVDAGSYYPRTADGMDRIARAAERATAAGTVFVTSGGNAARRHWRGEVSGTGWAVFDDNATEGNRLGDGPVAGSVTLRLYWSGGGDYDLYLYRDIADGHDRVVAKSTRGSGHAEAIDAVVPRGAYYAAVYARDSGDGPVDLFAARHRLAFAGANGSAVAPATADGVISVGALGRDGGLAAYSAVDTDVRAPGTVTPADGTMLRGTSAAAPAVAGVVARMTAAAGGEGLTPAQVERLLRETAADGRVSPDAAVAAARAGSRTGDDELQGTGDGGDPGGERDTNHDGEGSRTFPGP
ncbi:S8 family serine peptidase [Halobaculum gomorrense]|uniref:S8 family serine peptidase n=1 Tax=Halobaculum gomorrense TaxID=43928 RepID=UPI00116109C5|nr:S8 family serine peptidase [Halobaculum gomorrense]